MSSPVWIFCYGIVEIHQIFAIEIIGLKIFSLCCFSPVPSTSADITGDDVNAEQDTSPTSQKQSRPEGEEDHMQVQKFLKTRYYNEPVLQSKIDELSVKCFASNTDRKVHWCVKIYYQWCVQRNEISRMDKTVMDLDEVGSLTPANIVFALSRFICEIRKLDNSEFPPKTIYDIVIMIQFHLEKLGLNYKLLDGKEFISLRQVVDNVMKECSKQGLGREIKKAKVLDKQSIDQLWKSGVLGNSNP